MTAAVTTVTGWVRRDWWRLLAATALAAVANTIHPTPLTVDVLLMIAGGVLIGWNR